MVRSRQGATDEDHGHPCAVLNLEKTLLQACVDGEPGTYNLNTGGGGGGNTDLPGSSGSSGFSFGSS